MVTGMTHFSSLADHFPTTEHDKGWTYTWLRGGRQRNHSQSAPKGQASAQRGLTRPTAATPLNTGQGESLLNLFVWVAGPQGPQGRRELPIGHSAPIQAGLKTSRVSSLRCAFLSWTAPTVVSHRANVAPPRRKASAYGSLVW